MSGSAIICRMGKRGKLEAGWQHHQLVHDLAAMDQTQVQLAQKYGVGQPAISQFAARHADEITARKERIDDEFFGLWVASKRHRVAEYQADVEAINEALDDEADEKLLRAKLAIMRQVAEELGQLKTQVEVGGKLTYEVKGVDLSRLT